MVECMGLNLESSQCSKQGKQNLITTSHVLILAAVLHNLNVVTQKSQNSLKTSVNFSNNLRYCEYIGLNIPFNLNKEVTYF